MHDEAVKMADVPQRSVEMDLATCDLVAQIDNLDLLVDRLSGRLTPVLSQPAQPPGADPIPTPGYSSPLASHVGLQALRVAEIRGRLEALIARVEV